MAEIGDLSVTDASNVARFPENQAPSSLNDGGRALEGLIARGLGDTIDGLTTTGGTSTAYTVAAKRTITAYYNGLMFAVKFHTGSGASPTLDVDSVGPQAIVWPIGTPIGSGDISSSALAFVMYDNSNTRWVLLTHDGPLTGVALLASANEFTADQLIKSSDAGANPAPDMEVFRDSASPAVSDGIGTLTFTGRDSAANKENYARLTAFILDPTSGSEDGQIIFQTALAGAFARRMTLEAGLQIGSPTGADKGSGTLNVSSNLYINGAKLLFQEPYVSPDQTITFAGALTLPHSLSAAPTLVQVWLKCTSAEFNYSVGDEVLWGVNNSGGATTGRGVSVVPDGTNLNIRYGEGGSGKVFTILNKTTGVDADATAASWDAIFKAWV